jgi:hypothetical protein
MIERERRGEVIERFINIERVVNTIISQHYFGKQSLPFILQVLYDDGFNFGIKRRILERIVPELAARTRDDLARLNNIRNLFAHTDESIFVGRGLPPPGAKTIAVDLKKVQKWDGTVAGLADCALDYPALYEEFVRLAGPVEERLFAAFGKMGGAAIRGDGETQGS